MKRPKILVVDDEEAMVFSIQDYLSSYADCLGATSYEEATSIMEEARDVSLVISDIRMPGRDGFDLLMWIRQNRPKAKVVMITAYGSPSIRNLAKRRGAVLYLEKPLDLEQLLHVVRQIIEQKGFSVALKDMELIDLLQFLSFAGKAAKVQVSNPLGEEGEIGLDGENVLWIRSGSKRGEDAFYEIMSWESGSFEVLPLERGVEITSEEKLPVSLSFLLLEGARRRDEATVSAQREGGEATRGEEMGVVVEITQKLAEWQRGVSGFVASSLIRMDGTYITGTSNVPDVDFSVPAAYFAKAIKAIVENLAATNRGHWEEVLITTDTHYMILHKLTDDIFQSLTVTKAQGNLGMSRLQMEQLSSRVIKELR